MPMLQSTGSVPDTLPDRPSKEDALYRTFQEQSSEFYWLAYLLTGHSEQALEAYTDALEFDEAPKPAFRKLMVSWARKLVVVSALATMGPELRASALRVRQSEVGEVVEDPNLMSSTLQGLTKPELERAFLAIEAFPRCALLLTVFEKLPIEDAAQLLNSSQGLVRKAQALALIDLTLNLAAGRG